MKRILTTSFLIVLSFGCSLKSDEPDGFSKLLIDVKQATVDASSFDFYTKMKSNDFSTFGAAPDLISDFDCVGINVTGPGIASKENEPGHDQFYEFSRAMNGEACNYPGALSNFVVDPYPGQVATFNVNVPTGQTRLVQLVGLKEIVGTNGNPNTTCESLAQGVFPQDNNSGDDEVEPYELGRVFIPSLTGTQSIGLTTTWSTMTAAQKADRYFECSDCPPLFSQHDKTDDQEIDETGTLKKLAQKFIVSQTITINKIEIYAKIVNLASPLNIRVSVYDDNAGTAPMSEISNSFFTISTNDISSTSFSKISKNTAASVTLNAGTAYWLVIDPTTTMSAGDVMKFKTSTSDIFASEPMLYYNAGWMTGSPISKDLSFSLIEACN